MTNRHRLLDLLALAETATLVILLVNLVTAHAHGVTASVGPLHGVLYVAVVVLALFDSRLHGWHRLIAIIPGIGAPILLWLLRSKRSVV